MFVGCVICWEDCCGIVFKMGNGVGDVDVVVFGFEYWCGIV